MRLPSRLSQPLAVVTKVALLSTEAATVMEASAHILVAEVLASLRCLLAFPARVPFHQASLRPRLAIRQRLQASAARALALLLLPLAQQARSTRLRHLAYLQHHQAITLQRLPVTLRPHLGTHQLLRLSLRPPRHTAPLHPHILELPRRTIALRRPVSVPRRHNTARQARNLIQVARDAPPRPRRHPLSAPRVRRTLPPAQLATHNTRRRHLGTPLPLRARRRTLQIRGGHQPARRTRLRKSPLVIVVRSSLLDADADFYTDLLNRTKVPRVHHKCTCGT